MGIPPVAADRRSNGSQLLLPVCQAKKPQGGFERLSLDGRRTEHRLEHAKIDGARRVGIRPACSHSREGRSQRTFVGQSICRGAHWASRFWSSSSLLGARLATSPPNVPEAHGSW